MKLTEIEMILQLLCLMCTYMPPNSFLPQQHRGQLRQSPWTNGGWSQPHKPLPHTSSHNAFLFSWPSFHGYGSFSERLLYFVSFYDAFLRHSVVCSCKNAVLWSRGRTTEQRRRQRRKRLTVEKKREKELMRKPEMAPRRWQDWVCSTCFLFHSWLTHTGKSEQFKSKIIKYSYERKDQPGQRKYHRTVVCNSGVDVGYVHDPIQLRW